MAKLKEAVPDDGPGLRGSSEASPVPFGTPIKAVVGGDLPRVCKELERAVPGTQRYKARVDNYTGFAKHYYVLAKPGDEDGVKNVVLKASGVADYVAKAKKSGATIEEPVVVISELVD